MSQEQNGDQKKGKGPSYSNNIGIDKGINNILPSAPLIESQNSILNSQARLEQQTNKAPLPNDLKEQPQDGEVIDLTENKKTSKEFTRKISKKKRGKSNKKPYERNPSTKSSLANLKTNNKGILDEIGSHLEEAERHSGEAECRLAKYYLYGGLNINIDVKQARSFFIIAITKGSREAHFHLGFCYENGGNGLDKDYAEAVKCYERAADNGSSEAMYRFALLFESGGCNLPKNLGKAAEWYEKAINANMSKAMYPLALLFETGGVGLRQDLEKAVEWYTKADKAGDKRARSKLNELQNASSSPMVGADLLRHVKKNPKNVLKSPEYKQNLGKTKLTTSQNSSNFGQEPPPRSSVEANQTHPFPIGKNSQPHPSRKVKWHTKADKAGDERARSKLNELQNASSSPMVGTDLPRHLKKNPKNVPKSPEHKQNLGKTELTTSQNSSHFGQEPLSRSNVEANQTHPYPIGKNSLPRPSRISANVHFYDILGQFLEEKPEFGEARDIAKLKTDLEKLTLNSTRSQSASLSSSVSSLSQSNSQSSNVVGSSTSSKLTNDDKSSSPPPMKDINTLFFATAKATLAKKEEESPAPTLSTIPKTTSTLLNKEVNQGMAVRSFSSSFSSSSSIQGTTAPIHFMPPPSQHSGVRSSTNSFPLNINDEEDEDEDKTLQGGF